MCPPQTCLAVPSRSFPALSCEFATLDVSDAFGTKRLNLTKTVRKTPIDLDLLATGYPAAVEAKKGGPKYDEVGRFDDEDIDVTVPITQSHFTETLARCGNPAHGCRRRRCKPPR